MTILWWQVHIQRKITNYGKHSCLRSLRSQCAFSRCQLSSSLKLQTNLFTCKRGSGEIQPESSLTSNQPRIPEFRAGRGHCYQHTQMFHITNEETKAQRGESAC